jgi:hypothetical protein
LYGVCVLIFLLLVMILSECVDDILVGVICRAEKSLP